MKTVADWEERLSGYLQAAIDQPHLEPEICEELIEYVQSLVKVDRISYRQRCFEVVMRVFNRRQNRFKPKVLRTKEAI